MLRVRFNLCYYNCTNRHKYRACTGHNAESSYLQAALNGAVSCRDNKG